jgi:hypothetical protein
LCRRRGHLIVAEQGGSVQMLAPGPDALSLEAVATFVPLTGIPSEPSALAVLEDGREVLVTNQGQDQLFVFGLSVPGSPGGLTSVQAFALPPQVVSATPVAEPSAPVEAPLAVVVALVADILPAGPGASPASGGGQPAAAVDNGVLPVTVPSAAEPAGDAEDDEALTEATGPANEGFPPDIEERLRKLDLSPPPEDQPWGGPIGGVLFLDALQQTSDRLAVRGPVVSGELGQHEDGFELFSSMPGAWSSPAPTFTAFDRTREGSTGDSVDAMVWWEEPELAIRAVYACL